MSYMACACAFLLAIPAAAAAQRDTVAEFASPAGARRYMLHTPPARFGANRPLVVVLHGCAQDAGAIARGTGFSAAADTLGFAVLYPEQSPAANPVRCWNWFLPENHDRSGETALLAELTRTVARAVRADSSRIYVAGISAGAAAAVNLLASYPELFAGGAAHSGVMYRAANGILPAMAVMKRGAPVDSSGSAAAQVRDPKPLIVIHGARDTILAPVNGDQLALQWRSAFERATGRKLRGVTAMLHELPSKTGVMAMDSYWDDKRLMVQTVSVLALGHAWSGGSREGSYTDPDGPSATHMIVRFFGLSP